jgi:predicted helicase
VYQLPRLFPSADVTNCGIVLVAPGESGNFAVLRTDLLPDIHVLASNQFFARYRYDTAQSDVNQLVGLDSSDGWTRIDNVTDEILADYRATFGADVTKDDIFDYVYGILHSPDYRTRFAADLKKMLPRIPKVRDFTAFRDAGRELGKLHMDYESVPQHPGLVVSTSSTTGGAPNLLVKKMRYGGKRPNVDKTTIVYNDDITIRGIPMEAHEYLLGSRSALDWILERYQVKVDPASKIVNDANDWGLEHGNPRYILDLIGSIVTVSLETVRIVKSLPPLDILDAQPPSTT